MTPNKRQLTKWIRALRSGEYSQTRHTLQDEDGYCCLGVACEVLIPEKKKEKEEGYLSFMVPNDQKNSPKWLKVIDDDFFDKAREYLTELNDMNELTFDEIADCLEAVYVHRVLEE